MEYICKHTTKYLWFHSRYLLFHTQINKIIDKPPVSIKRSLTPLTVFFALLVPSYQGSTQILHVPLAVIVNQSQILMWSILVPILIFLGAPNMSFNPTTQSEKGLVEALFLCITLIFRSRIKKKFGAWPSEILNRC